MSTMPERLSGRTFSLGEFHDWKTGKNRLWPGYLIHGSLGSGKTSLALWMAHECGTVARFAVVSDVVRSVKETWGPLAVEQESDVLKRWVNVPFLILDEVGGVQFGTQAERNVIYDVVVGRYNRCRPTIITTNCNLNTQPGREEFYNCAGARIADRFQGGIIDAWAWGPSLRSVA
jgi:DNA replication protein DnaC